MHLSPQERDKLLIHVAADVARARRARGLRMNYPEAVALITDHVLEGARDGRTVGELMSSGRGVLTRDQVMDGVGEMIDSVQVRPRSRTAPSSSPSTVRSSDRVAGGERSGGAPGEIIPGEGAVPLNPGKDRISLVVANIADRPVQVGSHFHFAATNPGLEFDRAAAWGRHLDVPAGTSVRFEPGVEREVALVPFGGARVVPGLRVEFAGALDERDHEPRQVPYGGQA